LNKIIYFISGRSFKQNSLGRKISEVISCWKSKYDLEVFCGGDFDSKITSKDNQKYGNVDFHNQSFRKIKLLEPIVNSLSELKDIVHDRKLYKQLCAKYDEQKITLVWERSCRLHYSGYRYAKRRGVPFVLEWKDHLVDYGISTFKFYALWMERYKNIRADYIVVESEVLKDALTKQGVNGDKILVAYNAVNAQEFKPSNERRNIYRSSLEVGEDDILVGYIGSYAFYHDTERLVNAALILKNKGVSNVKFLFIGNGKEYQQCYELAKKSLLLGSTVIFKESIPKERVPEVLASIDISVLPGSTDIICPIKVFEYMAAGTVALVPDYPCNREVVSDFENGVLFQPHNENDLADKILWLSQNPEKIKSIGFQGRLTVKEKFTWDNTWGRVMTTIVDTIGADG
jgi:glycosyltransferase involved in cell wall biosynthesis